jgi:hypothetical protein
MVCSQQPIAMGDVFCRAIAVARILLCHIALVADAASVRKCNGRSSHSFIVSYRFFQSLLNVVQICIRKLEAYATLANQIMDHIARYVSQTIIAAFVTID